MSRVFQLLALALGLALDRAGAFLAPTSQPKPAAAMMAATPTQDNLAVLPPAPAAPLVENKSAGLAPTQSPQAAAGMAPTPPPQKSAKKSSCEQSCWEKAKKEHWGVCDALEKRYNDVQGKHEDHIDAAKRGYRMCSQGMRQAKDVCVYRCQGSDEL
eukprot:TRINITY_DN106529_c0_g1_i1.p2 TRINITY_DN106529_c0_g1~~TRINITY_DN106529_c0_g1_i1.p2  ORF type:complete len:157 (+),score=51.50 TRINITY_DN106529_c0_g1_i1:228-698(+)